MYPLHTDKQRANMAAAYAENAEEDLTCPLCFELFADPHIPIDLNCPHVICTTCLTKMIQGGPRIISCPECRKKTPVPKDGASSMKVNLRLRNLAEKHKKFVAEDDKVPHQDPVVFCPKHKDKLVSHYCSTCNVLHCMGCALHHLSLTHDVQDYVTDSDTIVDTLKQQLNDLLKEVKPVLTGKFTTLQILQEKETKFGAHFSREEQRITKARQEKCNQLNILAETQLRLAGSAIGLRHGVKVAFEMLKDEVQKRSEVLIRQLFEHGLDESELCSTLLITLQQEADKIIELIRETNKALAAENVTPKEGKLQLSLQRELLVQLVNMKSKLKSALESKTKDIACRYLNLQKLGFQKSAKPTEMGIVGFQHDGIELEKIQQFQRSDTTDIIATGADGVILAGGFYQNYVCTYIRQRNGRYKKNTKNLTLRPGEPVIDMTRTYDGKYIIAREGHVEVYGSDNTFERILYTSPRRAQSRFVFTCVTLLPNGNIVIGDHAQCAIVVFDPYGKKLNTVNIPFGPSCMVAIDDARVAVMDKAKWLPMNRVYVIDLQTEKVVTSTMSSTAKFGLCFFPDTNTLQYGSPCDGWDPDFAIGDPIHCEPGNVNSNRTGACVLQTLCPFSGTCFQFAFFKDLVRTQTNSIACASVPNKGSIFITNEYDGIQLYKVTESQDPSMTHYCEDHNTDFEMQDILDHSQPDFIRKLVKQKNETEVQKNPVTMNSPMVEQNANGFRLHVACFLGGLVVAMIIYHILHSQ